MNYIQYMKPGNKFWTLPNGQEDVSWSEFWNNWRYAITKAKNQIVDNWENLKQDYKDASDPVAASKRRQAESIEATRAKQASMKFVSDNRSDYEKKRDVKNLELKEFEQKEQQNKDATDAVMWTLTGIPYAVQHLASPNGVVKTYGNTKAAIQNGGGPYIEKAVASAAGDALDAFIIASPIVFNEGRQLARELNKNIKTTTLQPTAADQAVQQTISASTHSTTPDFSYNGQQDLKQLVNNARQYEALALLTDGRKDNFATFIDDLPNPVKHSSIPTSVKEHIETNIVPRLVQQRPWISSDRVIRDVELNTEGPWYTASRKVFDAAGYEPRVQGIHTSSTGNITIADDVEDLQRFLIHELRHKIDNGVPLTQHEDDLLNAAFGDEFLNIPYAKKNNYDMYNDMVTTIGDARTQLFGQGKGMPIEQQNFFIDQVPDNVIVNAIADSNGYGKEFIQLLQQNNALTPERIKAFREAMKYVGMSALPLLLNSKDSEQPQEHKQGGKLNYLNLIRNGKFVQ